uniref:Lipocalin/cytosolic fatty-acid binding domain-containing protein n=1 Tax=Monopterus albus TaxID=43700 RepID=A0A3Q3QQ86_MONAL
SWFLSILLSVLVPRLFWFLPLFCLLTCSSWPPQADGTCRRLNELSIQHTHTHTRWNNDNDMRIVEVLYDEYALVYTNKTKDGVSEVLNNLYSRTQEPSVAWQQRFTQFSLDTGILPENIVILPKNDSCRKTECSNYRSCQLQMLPITHE